MRDVCRIFIVVLGLLMVIGLAAWAQSFSTTGNPDDTATGTSITAYATNETLAYEDEGGMAMASLEVESGDETHTTTSEFGFSGPGSPSDQSVSPGDIVYHDYWVTQEGNANDPNYTVSTYYTEEAGAQDWVVEVWVGPAPTFYKTLEAGVVSVEGATSNDDSDAHFQYKVIVSSEAAGAPNSSYINIYTTWETTSRPTNEYTGGNYLTYGGWSFATDVVQDQVAAPVLTLTRTSTVDAPIDYTGGRHDAVPGSVITFTMTYTNEGAASAESVVLIDKVPNYAEGYTRLGHINNTGATTYVTIEAAQGNATEWTILYSTQDTLTSGQRAYGDRTVWTVVGTLSAGTEKFPGDGLTYLEGSSEASARWVKWEKQYVDAAEDTKSVTWGVTIR